ncbi:protein toll [Biomphalaria pfeifferi]|uniref:Protein toll n=1 Tax=Biomphalaria pfeifferi TaxID=112525 RepID=A0AAD8AXG3_BIOPF|nr:protein toll [Biomphalaria pfeifferi]
MGPACVGILPAFLFLSLPTNAFFSFLPMFQYEMNCSVHCRCRDSTLESTMKQYYFKHLSIMGAAYRPDIQNFDIKSDYMSFLGIFAPILHNIALVSCELSDGRNHTITSLLNGVDHGMYTALDVKCIKKETIIWDIPSWHTSFNIFVSDNCNVTTYKNSHLVVPMNMWIMDIDAGGEHVMRTIDLSYTLNTLSLALAGSRSKFIPQKWSNAYMCSVTLLSFKDNWLEDFNCIITLTKRLDTLNLEGNVMTRFPKCLLDSKYVFLNYLSLAHNRIQDLSPMYDLPGNTGVPDINIINLSYNDISEVHSLRDMGRLKILDLSHNKIHEISGNAFVNLKYLNTLFLGNNRLFKLDLQMLLPSSNLEKLDVSHNYILSVNEGNIVNISKTTLELDLQYNRLSNPPLKDCRKLLLTNTNLKILSAYNPYLCDCSFIEFESCMKWLEEQNKSSVKHVFQDLNQMKCSSPPSNKGLAIRDLNFHRYCVVLEDCPPSCTCYLQERDILKVNCSSRRFLEMPVIIPNLTNVYTVLYLDHNPLQSLNYQPYLSRLSEIYIDNCLLTTVMPSAIAALKNIRVMTLHNNLLQKLPTSTRNITLEKATNITLHNNRWACSCESLWLPRWISRHKAVLWKPGNILCDYFQKPLEDVNEADLNCKSWSAMDNFLTVILFVLSTVATVILFFCYNTDICAIVYSKLGIEFNSRLLYGDQYCPFDILISYGQDNYKWVVDTLVPYLEKTPGGYRVCLNHREFPSSDCVLETFPTAVRLSRSAILVLSKEFLQKEWCMLEVRVAIQRLLLVGSKLLIICMDKVNVDELSPELRAYIHTHHYLRYDEHDFWVKLDLFLPRKLLRNSEPVVQDSSLAAGGDCASNSIDKCEENEGTDCTEAL